MGAMGKGDMDNMGKLMADDMVWHNEGDKTLPWIGVSEGKDAIFKFLGIFSQNLETVLWENTDAFASGDTVAVFGKMNAKATTSLIPLFSHSIRLLRYLVLFFSIAFFPIARNIQM